MYILISKISDFTPPEYIFILICTNAIKKQKTTDFSSLTNFYKDM